MIICIIRQKRMKQMRINNWLVGILLSCLIVGCGKQIPSDVIQPSQMEEILYDYHLSVSMTNNLKSDEYYKRKAYQDYIFQKHSVTEAEFDSSMVWYTRHTSELAAIYSNLSERFKKDKQRIEMFLNARGEEEFVSLPGDTVDAWPYRKLYWLADNPMNNLFVFEIEPDTNFHLKDAFLWKANYTFLSEGSVIMAMNVQYDNDSVIGQSKQIVRSGMDSIYLHTDSTYQIKKINGFFYLSGDSLQKPNVLINDVSLTKYHAPKDSIASELQDSINASLVKDSVNVLPRSKNKLIDKPIKLQRTLPNE